MFSQGIRSSPVRARPVRERQVGPNELASERYRAITANDSPLTRMARSRGAETAAARGSSAGSYYAGAAERSLGETAIPLALQEAETYGRTAADNMAAQNERGLGELSSATTLEATGITAGSALEQARMRIEAERLAQEREQAFRRGEREAEFEFSRENRDLSFGREDRQRAESRGWQREDADRDYRRAVESGVVGRILETITSDPSYFRDPQAAIGMLERYRSEIRRILGLDVGG
jgi:hypothetical protein